MHRTGCITGERGRDRVNKPKERRCDACGGTGQYGVAGVQQLQVCVACNGRGVILYNEMSRGCAKPGQVFPYRGLAEMTADYAPLQMPVLDPQGAQRRDFALKTAMAAYQMCNGFSGGMFGTGGRGNGDMDWSEIVPLARAIERFLLGD